MCTVWVPRIKAFVAGSLLLTFLVACSSTSPTATVAPTKTHVPTNMPASTPTLEPTGTPSPSATWQPTNTPAPTALRKPTDTAALAESPRPDLIINRMSVTLERGGACVSESNQLGVRIWCQNVGDADAGRFDVKVNGTQQTVQSGLAAGRTGTLWFPGYEYARENTGLVDAGNQVDESDEDNNLLSLPAPVPTVAPTCTPAPIVWITEAQVVAVVDGDTIKVEANGPVYTVRYIGIDAPETTDPAKPVEWMSPEASDANAQLVAGKTVRLEKDVSDTDESGRLWRYVYVGDVFVNEELVRLGYAQVRTNSPNVKYQALLLAAQREARAAKRGLWSPTPTP